ncbi:MAG: Ribosomal protein S6--L-glutamate ligase [Planctomycetes bacterium]|nr:Ribosomal protein S6--L-glutamate ligase [Planctomycetota bacterium]
MRIAILDRSPHGNAADARSAVALRDAMPGHDVERVEVLDRLPAGFRADVALVRGDLRSSADLRALAALADAASVSGAFVIPAADALVAAEDKAVTASRLARAGVRMPATSFAPSDPPSFPCVVKPGVGWGGRGVVLGSNASEAAAACAALRAHDPGASVLYQEFIPHVRGITVQVAGGEAVCAFATRAPRGDFRTNPNLGGGCEDVPLDDAPCADAVRAVAACGLPFGSVDFVDAGGGRRVAVEVNAMPGIDPDDAADRRFARKIAAVVLAAGEHGRR